MPALVVEEKVVLGGVRASEQLEWGHRLEVSDLRNAAVVTRLGELRGVSPLYMVSIVSISVSEGVVLYGDGEEVGLEGLIADELEELREVRHPLLHQLIREQYLVELVQLLLLSAHKL
jgi:hypothetical protein